VEGFVMKKSQTPDQNNPEIAQLVDNAMIRITLYIRSMGRMMICRLTSLFYV
jgi:hypothetical protein